MVRIVDKDTRIVDIDFGQVVPTISRLETEQYPNSVTFAENGAEEIIRSIGAGESAGGSFIQYQRVDLDFMVRNNEVMQPVDVSVQRTSAVPNGGSYNGNITDYIEEYIWVLTRPLNHEYIENATLPYNNVFNPLRTIGLDGASTLGAGVGALVGGLYGGWPDQSQTIYAEKRIYGIDTGRIASVNNGILIDKTILSPPEVQEYNTRSVQPMLVSQNTWGTMGAITGPNLHVYRMVLCFSQNFNFTAPNTFVNEQYAGITSYLYPPVNVSFLCKDPNYTEGEYLTRIANAMNSIPEGGETGFS